MRSMSLTVLRSSCLWERSEHFLLDTGIGIGDLKGLVEEITDKPYDVVLTHGHRDHTGGAGWFDIVYLNRKDYELYPFPPTVEQRRDYARMIRTREHKYYPYKEESGYCGVAEDSGEKTAGRWAGL